MSFTKENHDPSLKDLFDLNKKDTFLSMNCHAIGIVEEFDLSNQTVKARIAYKKTFYQKEGKNYKEVLVDYPFLIDCPAIVISGGPFSLKMPIKRGDECLVLFNDRSIDKWFESGSVLQLDSDRLHSFSDGIVLVGLRSLARSIEGFDNEKVKLGDETHDLVLGAGEATLKSGSSVVSVKEKIMIKNSSKNLNTLLQDLIGLIETMALNSSMGPAMGLVNPAHFTAIKAEIGELLE